MRLDVGVQGLESDMELLGTVKLGIVGNEKLGVFHRGRNALEVDELGHLDLLVQTPTLVLAEARNVADRERVGALDCDLSWLAAIQALHALHFGEGNVIAIFKPVSCLIKGRDQTVLVNISNDAVDRVLARRVDNGKLLAKVAEQRAKKPKGVGRDEIDALFMAVFANSELDFEGGVGKDDDLILVELG